MSVDLSRLEAVTTRLEALEARIAKGSSGPTTSGVSGAGVSAASASPFVKAFDDLLAEFFNPVKQAAKDIAAPDVDAITNAFGEALQAQRAMLVVASKCKKPSDADLQKVLAPTSAGMAKVDSLKDRRSKLFNHLAMVAEGAACLQWVCVEPTPAPFLGDVIPGSEMYGNKIVMEHKGKDEKHVTYAKAFKTFLTELQKYVKAHHATGLSWNPSGGADYASSAASTAAPGGAPKAPGGGPPGPPPPPPPADFFKDVGKEASKPAAAGGGHAALFAELEARGAAGSAAAGLKKVSKDQMTHKNPALRASNVVSDDAVKSSAVPKAGQSAAVAKKPPRMEAVGSKWYIENFESREDLALAEASPKTAVLFVKNTKSLLQVPHKINTLSIDSCVKCRVLVDSCIASIEIINCSSVQIQITGSTPMITMDGCSGVIVYLSKQCVDDDVAIVSSKCSEMNIVLPAKSEDEDPVEMPIPEQFETKVRNGRLETSPISHVGA